MTVEVAVAVHSQREEYQLLTVAVEVGKEAAIDNGSGSAFTERRVPVVDS